MLKLGFSSIEPRTSKCKIGFRKGRGIRELTPEKDVPFIIGDWNAKVGSQEITWNNRQVWPWSTK